MLHAGGGEIGLSIRGRHIPPSSLLMLTDGELHVAGGGAGAVPAASEVEQGAD